ncbi:tetratricopeptide repeat protein [Geomonas edaphica]|uniref:tetratricopeptide repeat protein n=1 Tax=Geomonas edaphica TaxID=2570226 RepID=UPI0010A928D6|nr:hypothetical protein [Geomonas edaphica]
MDDIANKRIEKLTNQGLDHLEAGRYSEAIQVAMKLEEAKGPLAFYIAAEVYASSKNFRDAVSTMRRGVLKRPTFWTNWFCLGIYLGQLNKYEEALAAYEQALLCPQANADMIRLNMAFLSIACKAFQAALGYLDCLEQPSLRPGAEQARVAALEGVGRLAEAEALAEVLLKERTEGDGEYQKRVGLVAAALARIRLLKGRSKEEVRSFLMHFLEEFGCSTPVLYEIVKLEELRYSAESKYYRLAIVAKLPMDHPWYREAQAYGIVYDVVSDSEERALEMVKVFESAAGVESVDVASCKIRGDMPEEPMGVFWFSEKFFG